MPTGTYAPYPRFQLFDNSGDPLASGTLETYLAGTSTPVATYSDVALSVANPTTLTLNAAGVPAVSGSEVGLFLTPGVSYKFIVKDSSDVTLWTRDNINAVPVSAGDVDIIGTVGEAIAAGEVVYLADGTGGTTAGRWYKADADTVAASITAQVGMVSAAISSGASGSIRLLGRVTGLSGLVAGTTYYVSATAGELTSTAPTNARFVGQAESSSVLVLSPDPSHAAILQRTFRINAATPYTLQWPAADAVGFFRSSGAGVLSIVAMPADVCEGRLTFTTGVPVTTADVTGAATIYFTPYKGNRLALYDGSTAWKFYTFTERSLALGTLTQDLPYDVFLYDNAGTLTLELAAWTNDTTRATALAVQDGVYVKSGATTRRYLGTFRTTSTTQSEDSAAKRFLWNYYHRALRPMQVVEGTDSWTYSTDTFRQANAAATNQLAIVVGVAEDAIDVQVHATASGSASGDVRAVAVGADSTSTASGVRTGFGAITDHGTVAARLVTVPAIGYHFYAWLERAEASGTTTWYGDGGGTALRSGITALWRS